MDDVQTNIRLPARLKDRLVELAAENHRSLSAEITARLESTLTQDQPKPAESELMRELLEALRRQNSEPKRRR